MGRPARACGAGGLRHPLHPDRRPRGDRHRLRGRCGRSVRGLPLSAPDADAAVDRRAGRGRAAADLPAAARPLGQPRRHHRARLRRPSLWKWAELPGRVDPRVADYARANASIGINGTVINSVNAAPSRSTHDIWRRRRPWPEHSAPTGCASTSRRTSPPPKLLGGLPTADPLDPAVAQWWRDKADEIYRLIPDFGGFLVKANSEGQPGPAGLRPHPRRRRQRAGRRRRAARRHRHVARLRLRRRRWTPIASSAPTSSSCRSTASSAPTSSCRSRTGRSTSSRASRSIPLFGAMPKTPLMAELQITQEYLGQSTHLVYLAPMWKEFLDADTYANGPGSSVAKIVDGTLRGYHARGSRASPTPGATATGAATTSPRRTGTPSAGWPGTRPRRRRDRGRVDPHDLGTRTRRSSPRSAR